MMPKPSEECRVVFKKPEILRLYPFYREAPTALQHQIAEAAISARLKPGTYFYNHGEFCDQAALIDAGSIRIFVNSETGREVTVYYVGPGQTCPLKLLCALLGTKAPAAARVTKPLHGVALPTPVVRHWVETHKGFRHFVLESLDQRIVDRRGIQFG